MQKGLLHQTVIDQELRAVKLFLVLYYLLQVIFDYSLYYLFPGVFSTNRSFNEGGLGYFLYIIELALLPYAIYLIRQKNPFPIKYLYLGVFLLATMTNDIMMYWGVEEKYQSGNIGELLFLFFTPIFLNRRYFFYVMACFILKYAITGIVLMQSIVIVPISLTIVISSITYILLNRFLDYVKAVRESYNVQMEEIVKGIVATLELKDPYTRGHSERVAHFSLLLAHRMGQFSEEELKLFYYACLLHDVGKVNIPDYILTKPSSLTEAEYDIIKSHPVVGANAMKGIEGLKDSVEVILHHHEHWDGNGYPDQLLGDEIPILARITSVADAFDAMTTMRSYRDALPVEEAYRRIIDGKGKQFDPRVVEAFQEIFPLWVDYIKQRDSLKAAMQNQLAI
ncbi:HD-GYP domain-containing protein [Paenibacillus koleovorans]|uniref:HD-GYP domain-containing protein n=1 Tax=Paenibacillus koleovorans TaxID=121608 RepID=UPI000FD8152B|nr:HD-GYP domain-containing protein [Paenibacillus koleovorans]